ncbi:MAG TPA: hypothetical protein VG099_15025 [Gemmataceae bacterium]|jgi:hypothetical protein|nr:hypothetical protein [Gemmataceae bacterium]
MATAPSRRWYNQNVFRLQVIATRGGSMIRKRISVPKSQKRAKQVPQRSQHGKLDATLATLDKLEPVNPRAEEVISLLRSWLEDDSGYDEETWPELKKSLAEPA